MNPMKNKGRRAFALFLALAVCFGLLQTFAFAEEGEGIFSAIAEAISNETPETDSADETSDEDGFHVCNWVYGETIIQAPTCTDNGMKTTYQICTECGKTYNEMNEVVSASAEYHTWGEWRHQVTDSKPATCVDDGYEAYRRTCELCGAVERRQDPLPATGKHLYGEDHQCTVCGNMDPNDAAHEHVGEWRHQATASKPATCVDDGYEAYRRTCELCGEVEHRQDPLPATDKHLYDDDHYCTVCGNPDPNYAAPEPEPEPHTHSWGAWVHQGTSSYAATCSTVGLDVYIRSCNVCNVQDTEKYTKIISATGEHHYENGVCTVCGKEDETVPAPQARLLVTCDDSLQYTKAGDTVTWNVTLANTGDTEIQTVMASNANIDAYYQNGWIRPSQQYINIQPGTAGTLTITYQVDKDTFSAVDDILLQFADENSDVTASIWLRYIVDGTATVDPDPVDPDPVDPTPVNPNPTPATPANPTPAPAAPAAAPAAPAAVIRTPAAEEDLDDPDTPTADPEEDTEEEEVDEPETPMAAPEEDLKDPETPMAAPEEDLDEGATPLAAPGRAAWAVLNLILMLCTGLAGALLLLDPTSRESKSRSGILRLVSLVPALGALVAFLLTEDVRLPMVLADRWTLLMVLIALVQLGVCVVAKKAQDSSDNSSDGPAAARA